jgi:Polyketide cyclase / dehydrase and lipid transport
VCGFAFRRMKRGMAKTAAQTGIDNPCAAPIGGVPLSREEKSVTLKMTALVLAACVVVIAPVIALVLADIEAGMSGLAGMLAWCLVALGAVTWATVGRWPGKLTLSSTIEIAATPQQVWSTIRYVGEQPYYKGIVRRVEKVDATGETYLLHYYTEDDCSDCGLPKHPDTPGVTSLVEIVEAIEPRVYRLRSWPKTTDPVLKNSMDHEDESFLIEPLVGGRCRVTNTSTLERPRVWLAALLKLGDPLGEHLRNLKAHIEGSPAGTIFETGAARIAAARVAERHCGCGELAKAA